MAKYETATLAAGCFWCVEAVFQRIKGIVSVISGYSGGNVENPTYELVSSGSTGHAEAAQILFDPNLVNYRDIVKMFFLTHDPTQLNRQGSDVGTQYRSAIFYHSDEQKKAAEEVKKEIEDQKLYSNPIVTEISPFKSFFEAEKYHQNFYNNNRNYPYCKIIIDPKIRKLQHEFADMLKNQEEADAE